jgi:hypothetical protein
VSPMLVSMIFNLLDRVLYKLSQWGLDNWQIEIYRNLKSKYSLTCTMEYHTKSKKPNNFEFLSPKTEFFQEGVRILHIQNNRIFKTLQISQKITEKP